MQFLTRLVLALALLNMTAAAQAATYSGPGVGQVITNSEFAEFSLNGTYVTVEGTHVNVCFVEANKCLTFVTGANLSDNSACGTANTQALAAWEYIRNQNPGIENMFSRVYQNGKIGDFANLRDVATLLEKHTDLYRTSGQETQWGGDAIRAHYQLCAQDSQFSYGLLCLGLLDKTFAACAVVMEHLESRKWYNN